MILRPWQPVHIDTGHHAQESHCHDLSIRPQPGQSARPATAIEKPERTACGNAGRLLASRAGMRLLQVNPLVAPAARGIQRLPIAPCIRYQDLGSTLRSSIHSRPSSLRKTFVAMLKATCIETSRIGSCSGLRQLTSFNGSILKSLCDSQRFAMRNIITALK